MTGPAWNKAVSVLCSIKYRIVGKFGEDFNLAVWQIVTN